MHFAVTNNLDSEP